MTAAHHPHNPGTRPTAITFLVVMECAIGISLASAQNTDPHARIVRSVVPLAEYISIEPATGGPTRTDEVSLARWEIKHLTIRFHRDRLPKDAGPQFVRIQTAVYARDGNLVQQTVQYALTFPPEVTPEEDVRRLEEYTGKIIMFGFFSPEKIEAVPVVFDTIPDWGQIRVEVRPDDEFTKYAYRTDTKLTWHYLVQGNRFESGFFLGIPKVLYDSRSSDTVNYGNTSAMVRAYYLDAVSGERFPLSIGMGLFGVSTPLDVSRNGGGLVLSVFFDLVQFLRLYDIDVTNRVNAGFEIGPFFPQERKSRILFVARLGYSP